MPRNLRAPAHDADGAYTLQEDFKDSAFMSFTTARFAKKADRDDFLAFVEYVEHLAPKGWAINYYVAMKCANGDILPAEWAVSDVHGGEMCGESFTAETFREAVRLARAHVEALDKSAT